MITEDVEDYKVLNEKWTGDLEKSIKKNLKKGWLLYGPPFHKADAYCQAVVKLKKKEKISV